ncbi:hypothetical protein V2J09_023148 [Rumex salicifolius]
MVSPIYSLRFTLRICVVYLLMGVYSAQLSSTFYKNSSPKALSTVKSVVANEPRMGASLLRLHFHDCFVDMIYLWAELESATGPKRLNNGKLGWRELGLVVRRLSAVQLPRHLWQRRQQPLPSGPPKTSSISRGCCTPTNSPAFFADFAAAMVKMSNLSPLTASAAHIRTNCRVVNS